MTNKNFKNVTFSASAEHLNKARLKALRENTSLNKLFRQWLAELAEEPKDLSELRTLWDSLSYAESGGKFSREEMNER